MVAADGGGVINGDAVIGLGGESKPGGYQASQAAAAQTIARPDTTTPRTAETTSITPRWERILPAGRASRRELAMPLRVRDRRE